MRIWLFAVGAFVLIPALAEAKECVYTEKSFLARVVAFDSQKRHTYGGEKGGAGEATSEPPLLGEKEIVLSFEQGPHSAYTKYVLDILDKHCVKATFFLKGSAALANSVAVRDVARRGHTLAGGVWSKANAAKPEDARNELESALAAVAKASKEPVAPFLRMSQRALAPEFQAYIEERGVSLWYADIESGDGDQGLTPTAFANRTLARLKEAGKGVLALRDTSKMTVDALDSILINMEIEGFKIVQIVPTANFEPKAEVSEKLSLPAAVAPPRVARPAADQRAEQQRRDAPRPLARETPRVAAPAAQPQRRLSERENAARQTGSGADSRQ
ncbi:polysaccharide deacetylase family protein [Rhodomicrobium udaipurense]|uniref:Chitooligosaccharide deacetylase n=2 Tax=Rhodomicrobium udaipurense TaxID=1202716 RepID=A0A8I1KKN7_9HYPH|nr:polysaccharide deacetylase family protein [Rhodomicrobium udaipurense]MBJ7544299.1 polysaccharide deacetylase family protein [Rhodomicrobium udaipurense]